MRHHFRTSRPRPQRRGVLALELLFVFPILLVLVLAVVQFGLTLHARQQLLAASREGCRVAAVGGSPEQVTEAVRKCLGAGRLGQAETTISDETGAPVPPGSDVPSGELVQVWVRIPAGFVVPDLLRFIGVSQRNTELVGRTTMRRE